VQYGWGYGATLHAVSGRDDDVRADDAGAADVVDAGADNESYAALPRPRVTPCLDAADDTSQRHMRLDGRLAAVARVEPRLRHNIYIRPIRNRWHPDIFPRTFSPSVYVVYWTFPPSTTTIRQCTI